MDSYKGIKNRRSDSQLMPRLFLLLQIVIMILVSNISFTILSALNISFGVISAILVIANTYVLNKIFSKCRNISKRNTFHQRFQTN